MLSLMGDVQGEVEDLGYSIVPEFLSSGEVDGLTAELAAVEASEAVRRRGGVYAIRNLLALVPAVARLAESEKVMELVRSALGKDAFAVRGTLFDKTPDANWLVPWHQDLTICVKQRVDVDGYGPWTVKAGVPHVQPPVAVLDGMLAVRIHLDDCCENNGALRVLPGTHRAGRLTAEKIESAQRNSSRPVTCAVGRGGVVLMKPLLLHGSSAAKEPAHRRVIHIDFATGELAEGLEWA